MSKVFYTVEQIKNANKLGGFTFFNAKEMRLFKARINPGVYGGRYFVGSTCQGYGHARTYSVYRAAASGDVLPVSSGHDTLDKAKRAAKKLAYDDIKNDIYGAQ